MSDYSITADYDKHHQDQDWQAYIEALEAEPEEVSIPNCGMCVHFVPEQRYKAPSDGHELTAASYCKLRASADLPCLYKSLDSAENCRFFDYDCPF